MSTKTKDYANPTSREDVYRLIDGERAYQAALSSEVLSVGEEIALAIKYSNMALDDWTNDFSGNEDKALATLRKVAGICTRALEHYGAPERVYTDTSVAKRRAGC